MSLKYINFNILKNNIFQIIKMSVYYIRIPNVNLSITLNKNDKLEYSVKMKIH